MTGPAISVEHLSKSYRIARAPKASGTAERRQRSPIGLIRSLNPWSAANETEILRALDDVSFEIRPGEVVGLVGSNGAGKSTLLKILSRITEPTTGLATIDGRVGSLLEVGTGFHPELTGRENIYLSGAILGMRRVEINESFDQIVAFSEVERFLDTPVKRYSSGMYVRLAFGVAAHLRPEVLLVDEVLAVGDMAFQKKCLGKMSDVGRQGRTVLFVSHNVSAVQSLCQRVIWLQGGRLAAEGPTAEILGRYVAASFQAATERSWEDPQSSPGNDRVRLHTVRIAPANPQAGTVISMSTPVRVEIEYSNLVPGAHMHVSLRVLNEGHVAFTSASDETDPVTRDGLNAGVYRSVCVIPGNLLNRGLHSVGVLFRQDGRRLVLRCDDVLGFDVQELEDRSGTWFGWRAQGVVHPRLQWETTYLDQPTDVEDRAESIVSAVNH